MRLNQITVTLPDLDSGWDFYAGLGLKPIVDARPDYVRFSTMDDYTTFSMHKGEEVGHGTTVYFECDDLDATVLSLVDRGYQFATQPTMKSWLWREAELFDPGGNRIILYHAGENRLNPPWSLANKR